MPKEKWEIRHCPNCGEIVDNRFCPACGQENREYKATFKEMIKEFTSHAFNLDSRFLKTVKHLLFHPGCPSRGKHDDHIFCHGLIIFSRYFISNILLVSLQSSLCRLIKYTPEG